MPYNGSGSFSVVNTFVPNTTILSSKVNENYTDIATNGLSNVLVRDGQAAMTGQFKAANGTALAPSVTFGTDLDTGRYRVSANTMADVVAGAEVVRYSTSGIDVTGAVSQNGSTLIPIGMGPLPWSRTAAPDGWVFVGKTYNRADYPALWAVAEAEIALGNLFYTNGNGTTTFGVGLDMPGRVPACNDAISGTPANVLTDATTIGEVLGDEECILTTGQLPTITPAGTLSLTSSLTDLALNSRADMAIGGSIRAPVTLAQSGSNIGDFLSSATINTTGTFSGTPFGSGQGHPNVQPTIVTNYIIFAGG